MRYVLLLLSALLIPVSVARADVSISIGINVPAYPTLVRVPGYPAYYDPRIDGNYFFFDGLYWVFWDDRWYASSWYNGPWQFVDPFYVPVYVLCIPVRYYRHRPHYFSHWHDDEPPHWGEHWGHDWERRRHGWDRWDRHSAPEPAPLPHYQRNYAGDRYPRDVGRQQRIRADNYHFEPHERFSRQQFRRETQRAQADPGSRMQREPRSEREPSRAVREPRPERESPRVVREPRPEREPSRVVREPRPERDFRSEREPVQQAPRGQQPSWERREPRPQGRSDREPRPESGRTVVSPRQERQDVPRERPAPRDRGEPDGSRQGSPSREQTDRPRGGRDRDEREQGRDRN